MTSNPRPWKPCVQVEGAQHPGQTQQQCNLSLAFPELLLCTQVLVQALLKYELKFSLPIPHRKTDRQVGKEHSLGCTDDFQGDDLL